MIIKYICVVDVVSWVVVNVMVEFNSVIVKVNNVKV